MLAVFAGLVGYVGYDGFRDSLLEQYEDGALLTASTAADIIDGEDLYRYNQSEGHPGGAVHDGIQDHDQESGHDRCRTGKDT